MEAKESSTSDPTDAAAAGNDENLQQLVENLREEKRKIQNEFNAQRAKMKELYLQKETELNKCHADRKLLQRELDEMKSQFVVADLKSENELHVKELKAQEEISSLQQLVQDTIEESTILKAELERMKEENSKLWQENREYRDHVQQQPAETTSLAPQQMLSHVKKTLRKLGGDTTGSIIGNSLSQSDGIDESSKSKSGKKDYAQEDAEVLRSIVVQLQEEMEALKEKLRETDDKLRNRESSAITNAITHENDAPKDDVTINKSTSIDINTITCDACIQYEKRLQELQAKSADDQATIAAMQKAIAASREDLQKEAALRKDLEDQWQERREAHKTEVQKLREQVKSNEEQLLELQQRFLDTKEEVMRQLQRVTDERERVNKQLETLQADNDFLSGSYLASSLEIESQVINLPNTVEELQELILQQQNDLIQARVNSEHQRKQCVTSLDEIQILRDQLEKSNNERLAYKKKMQTDNKSLQDRLTEHLLTIQTYETAKTTLERKEAELNRQISRFRVEVIELQDTIEKLTKLNADYKTKIKILQEDLATSEQVQKDFVKLSQNLQMSLEKLRKSDTEVRWQEDEDVDNCPTCNTYFTVTVRKIHCRHCGHIYCEKCLTKTVPSGPRKKIVRVCDICHTLLTPNTAPYFSQEPVAAN
ncbi:rab GTPase-binding effector protein 1 isoform X1 [Zeugodacus cucurbitae]|uniref:Rab GTPase-binding effector protein 1 n=1 Tax=Zeugodacus cucurbitae TaxID=28588 RepID=A0A0A1WXF9_ZEUCU|nr:rab GTPase-binding effector protein 1 isoform X1 [Zeugodacus cucurbitae]